MWGQLRRVVRLHPLHQPLHPLAIHIFLLDHHLHLLAAPLLLPGVTDCKVGKFCPEGCGVDRFAARPARRCQVAFVASSHHHDEVHDATLNDDRHSACLFLPSVLPCRDKAKQPALHICRSLRVSRCHLVSRHHAADACTMLGVIVHVRDERLVRCPRARREPRVL